MLALIPQQSSGAPFLATSTAPGAERAAMAAPPALAALAARASLPAPRLIHLGGGSGGGGDDADGSTPVDDDDAEAGRARPHLAIVRAGLAAAHGAAHAVHATLAGATLAVCLVGRITNLAEVAALYGVEVSSDGEEREEVEAGEGEEGEGGAAPGHVHCTGPAAADLLVDVKMRGFPDACGDASDQPATFLAALAGSWALVMLERDGGRGGALHVTVARSAAGGRGSGGEGAEEEEAGEEEEGEGGDGGAAAQPPPPLFWGAVEGGGLVITTASALAPASPGGHPINLAPFPPGCFWTGGGADASSASSTLSDFTRPSPAARPVAALARRDSRGRLCALAYRSKSGRDLAAGADSMVE